MFEWVRLLRPLHLISESNIIHWNNIGFYCLGPILFISCMNDSPHVLNVLQHLMFADDTTFSHANNDVWLVVLILNWRRSILPGALKIG